MIWVFYPYVMLCGMIFSFLGVILPDVMTQLGIDHARSGLLPLALYLGACAGTLAVGIFIQKTSNRMWMILSLGIIVFASVWASLAQSLLILLFCLFGLGAAQGIGVLFSGMVVQKLTRGQGNRSMNILFSFFSAGLTVEPLIATRILSLTGEFQHVMLALGGCAFALLPISLFLSREKQAMKVLVIQHIKPLFSRYRHIVIGLAALQFLYVGIESIANIWIPKYLSNTFSGRISLNESAFILALFWAAITAGRWICAGASRILSPFRLLMILSLLAIAGLALAPMSSQLLGAESSFILLGLGMSGMFPFILANTERVPKDLAGTLFVTIIIAGTLGGGIFSAIVGPISQSYGFRAGLWSALLPMLILVFGYIHLYRRCSFFNRTGDIVCKV